MSSITVLFYHLWVNTSRVLMNVPKFLFTSYWLIWDQKYSWILLVLRQCFCLYTKLHPSCINWGWKLLNYILIGWGSKLVNWLSYFNHTCSKKWKLLASNVDFFFCILNHINLDQCRKEAKPSLKLCLQKLCLRYFHKPESAKFLIGRL